MYVLIFFIFIIITSKSLEYAKTSIRTKSYVKFYISK